MKIVKVIEIEGSLGFIIPEEFIKPLQADKNDFIGYIEIPNGFRLVPYDPQQTPQEEEALECPKQKPK